VVPDAVYYRFNEGSGTSTSNVAVPGVGNLNATLTGHTFGTGKFGAGLVGTGMFVMMRRTVGRPTRSVRRGRWSSGSIRRS
jgi:hypothetical protein